MKTITFAIPCYNSEAYMDKCIESILAFDDGRSDIEILIVDDGSAKDNTAQKADSWHDRYPDTLFIKRTAAMVLRLMPVLRLLAAVISRSSIPTTGSMKTP